MVVRFPRMDAAAFLILVQRKAGGSADLRDPLAAAKDLLAMSGETAEGKALREVLRTLASGNGTFKDADIWLFSKDRLRLIASLIEMRIAGLHSKEEWNDLC